MTRHILLLLLLLSVSASAQEAPTATISYAWGPLATTVAQPTLATDGISLASVVRWRVILTPSTGTFTGAGTLEAYYYTRTGSPLGTYRWVRAALQDCKLSTESHANASGLVCGDFSASGYGYDSVARIAYVPKGIVLTGGTTLMLGMEVVVR